MVWWLRLWCTTVFIMRPFWCLQQDSPSLFVTVPYVVRHFSIPGPWLPNDSCTHPNTAPKFTVTTKNNPATHTDTHTCMHTHTAHTHACTHTDIHTHMHTHTFAHVHTHTRTHTCSFLGSSQPHCEAVGQAEVGSPLEVRVWDKSRDNIKGHVFSMCPNPQPSSALSSSLKIDPTYNASPPINCCISLPGCGHWFPHHLSIMFRCDTLIGLTSQDPLAFGALTRTEERHDLSREYPHIVKKLLFRLQFYQKHSVSVYFPAQDPRLWSQGHWGLGPWMVGFPAVPGGQPGKLLHLQAGLQPFPRICILLVSFVLPAWVPGPTLLLNHPELSNFNP